MMAAQHVVLQGLLLRKRVTSRSDPANARSIASAIFLLLQGARCSPHTATPIEPHTIAPSKQQWQHMQHIAHVHQMMALRLRCLLLLMHSRPPCERRAPLRVLLPSRCPATLQQEPPLYLQQSQSVVRTHCPEALVSGTRRTAMIITGPDGLLETDAVPR